MINNYKIRHVKNSDMNDVRNVYNYYVKNEFAAYAEKDVPIDFFNNIKEEALSFYILEINAKLVGFAVLRNYLPYDNFKHTGKLTYFIRPEYTNKGYGTILFNKLIEDAKQNGMSTIIVHLSSLNDSSLYFHKKHGFEECGRFNNIAKKFNRYFDIIWMQKTL